MKIVLMVEGTTEKAFLKALRLYLSPMLTGRMPNLDGHPYHGRIPKGEVLRRHVEKLSSGREAADHVIALTDVYTGLPPRDLEDAADAKRKMREWVGRESRFHPHAAQYDFEAWLLPYWPLIRDPAGSKGPGPSGNPENVNHQKPPSKWIKEACESGEHRRSYIKAIHADRILRGQSLAVSVSQCTELKALVNTILQVSGGTKIPWIAALHAN